MIAGFTYHVPRNQFTSQYFLLGAVPDDNSTHSNITLQTGNYIGSLLLLIPADSCIQTQDTDDDTEVDPVL
jgi:hypothetical protein